MRDWTFEIHGLLLGLQNIMSWSSKQTLWHFTVVIDLFMAKTKVGGFFNF